MHLTCTCCRQYGGSPGTCEHGQTAYTTPTLPNESSQAWREDGGQPVLCMKRCGDAGDQGSIWTGEELAGLRIDDDEDVEMTNMCDTGHKLEQIEKGLSESEWSTMRFDDHEMLDTADWSMECAKSTWAGECSTRDGDRKYFGKGETKYDEHTAGVPTAKISMLGIGMDSSTTADYETATQDDMELDLREIHEDEWQGFEDAAQRAWAKTTCCLLMTREWKKAVRKKKAARKKKAVRKRILSLKEGES